MAVKIGKQVSNSFGIDTLFCNLKNMHFEKYHGLVNFLLYLIKTELSTQNTQILLGRCGRKSMANEARNTFLVTRELWGGLISGLKLEADGGWSEGKDGGKYKITWFEFVWKIQGIQFWKLDGNLLKPLFRIKLILLKIKITHENLLDVTYRSGCWSRAWHKIVLILFAFNQETNQVPDESFFKKLFLRRFPVCCCKVETQFPEMSHNNGRDNSFR